MIRIQRSASRRAAVVVLVSIAPLGSAAAQSPREFSVKRCPAADTLFRTANDDVNGMVRSWYKADRDSTILLAGDLGRGLEFFVRFAGQRPDLLPWAQLTLFLHAGKGTDTLTEGAMPVVTATLDDSTCIDLAPAQVGASRGGTVFIPVSAYVSSENLLAIAKARTTRFAVGKIVVAFRPDDRRNLRALYHIALCAEVPTK